MVTERALPIDCQNLIEDIAARCGISSRFARILVSRGIKSAEDAERFLHPDKSALHDPFDLLGMKEAVERITAARDNGETVVVYGDYDADGITATTILVKALKIFGIEAFAVVPERENGYGLTEGVYEQVLEEWGPDLIITVDCGISAVKEVADLADLGVDVIVTDHHEIPEEIPDCTVINCKLKQNKYPFDGLCGAGVAYKLAYALIGERANDFFDLVTIATIADSMPMLDENRYIVACGVKMIAEGRCSRAVKALVDVAATKEISSTSIAFTICPRVNAAGRMGDAYSALEFFLTEDNFKIRTLANKLNEYNTSRQNECDLLYRKIKSILSERRDIRKIITLYSEDFKSGFIGIVAAKLVEEYSKPVILFSEKDGLLHGSARSIPTISIFEVINSVRRLTVNFGGHAQAAGVTIRKEDFEEFANCVDNYIGEHYDVSSFDFSTEVDEIVEQNFDMDFAKELLMLEPCGMCNRKPQFAIKCNSVVASPLKLGSPHVSFGTSDIDLIWFGGVDKTNDLISPIGKYIIFEPNISVFNKRESLRGFVRRMETIAENSEVSEAAVFDRQISDIKSESGNYSEIGNKDVENLIEKAIKEIYGTVFIVSDPSHLDFFDGLKNMPKFAFKTEKGGNISSVSLGFEGYLSDDIKRVVFIDKPLKVPKISEKVEVYVNTELDGVNLLGVSSDRNVFGKIYLQVKNGRIRTGAASDIALSNDFGFSVKQVIFALRVFGELKLLRSEYGYLTVDSTKKCELSSSEIYSYIADLLL